MITIRASWVRELVAAALAGWDSVVPRVAGDVRAVDRAVARAGTALVHQYQSGRDARQHSRARVDSKGRRLRASAHGTGPGRSGAPRGGRPGGWAPAVTKLALVVVLAAGAFFGSSSAYINFAADLPDAHTIAATPVPEDSLIYASDGTTLLADVHPKGNQHYYEPLTTMGSLLPQATIAIEDSNFYHEVGVDPVAMARAAWVDWRAHRAEQGASTITQQLVKIRLLDSKQTFDRKVKEAVLALQVDRDYSKSQILEMYLNSVFYGNNAEGSLAASRLYFHRDTKDLDLAQASMLAGIPQSPLYNSPFTNWPQAKSRQKQVLDAMVRTHAISAAEADKAFAEDLDPKNGKMFTPVPQVVGPPGFTYTVIDSLVQKYGRAAVEGGGMRVVTTINLALQKIAEQAMAQNLDAQRWRHVSQGALVSIDPHTGAIVAMVGAADLNGPGGQYNFAVWPPRNPGSSFKVFNYTAAIASGKFTMTSPIQDSPIRIPDGSGKYWEPKNYDLSTHGTCQLQVCMGNSLNIPAVRVELGTGVPSVVDTARGMGAPPWVPQPNGSFTSNDPTDAFGPALALGGYGETPLQMATGMSVLAAQGTLHDPYAVASIKSADGTEIFKAEPTSKQVLDPKVAFIMEQIMSDDDNRAMIFGRGSALTLPGRRVGAKTGTTDDFKDAWTVGYTPDLATAVWYGNPDWSALVTGSDGVFVAAPAWHNYMQGALDALQKGNVWFNEPDGLTHAFVNGKVQYYLPGTSPSTPVPPLPPGVQSVAPAPKPSPSPSPG